MLLAMEYLPYDQRPASTQYRRVLAHILGTGIETETRQGVNALTAMQQTMTFRLAEGFPVITERSIRSFWRKPIGELCAFINGATTLKEFEAFGVDWWGPWATPEKTLKKGIEPGGIGPGSYGGAFHDFPAPDGPFDQFKHLVEQLWDHAREFLHRDLGSNPHIGLFVPICQLWFSEHCNCSFCDYMTR